MEKRCLGKTGEKLSVVGFGGIVVKDTEPAEASRYVAQAIDRGINYFDIAPSYGNAQEKLGPALEPYRKSVFLACKTEKRNKEEAAAALQQSLKHLRTDHFDLYQLHGVTTIDEVEAIFAPGGAIEAFVEAKKKGLVRFLGFSAHSDEAAVALLDRFPFDTILFPFNWVCWLNNGFGQKAMAKAQEKGVGILALKALAKRRWNEGETRKWPKCWYAPVDTAEEALLGVRFTLSLPTTAAVSPGHAELLWWACDAAEKFTPLSKAEEAEAAKLAKGLNPIFPH